MSQHTDPQALSGQLIAHYRVARHLGSGGMGEVFLAEDTRLDRSVALKLLPREVAADASRRKRFLAEAKAASALNHSNVCTIYEVGETAEGQPFIAMEYLEALDALARRRRLELREIVWIGGQVAEALEAARQSQIVHRDIKPGNIVVLSAKGEVGSEKLHVKVLDFGLAKRLDRPAEASVLTQEGAILGTPNYLSPELALGREVDSRSDIFSLGVVLYELAAGKNPFAGASFGDTVNNLLNRQPESLRGWNPTVTPEFERIVFKCLEKDVAKRYAMPGQLRDDLAKVQTHLQSPQTSNQKLWAVAAIVVALGVTALGLTWLMRSKPATPSSTKPVPLITSLAVKPLDDFSGDTNNAYLSDGMTEALCSALGNISALRVPGRSSVMRFKGGQKSIREMARELKVDAIVEGSVQRAGNRIRVSAQLIHAATDRHLWSTNFNRDLSDFFVVQDELARAIADEVQVRLTPEDQARLGHARPAKSEAVEACLLGRYYWLKLTTEDNKKAVDHLKRAIEIDPEYALAYAHLADAYRIGFDLSLASRDLQALQRKAARKALELDPALAEAHVQVAYVQMRLDWDWAGAEKEFQEAIRLNPNYAMAHDEYAFYLFKVGRFEEAIAQQQQALRLDPLSLILNADLAWVFYHARKFDLAIEQARKTVALDPYFPEGHNALGMSFAQQGQYAAALEALRKARSLDGNTGTLSELGIVAAMAGQRELALKTVSELKARGTEAAFVVEGMAMIHAALDEKDEAFLWLQKAFEERSWLMTVLKVERSLDNLRSDPRFTDLLRKVGLSDSSIGTKSPTNATAAALQKSVAVLPFVNVSGNKADEPLSDGITDELISTLQPVNGLQVKGRASSFHFKGKNERLQKIGQELQVKYLVEGTVSRAGNKLRITVDLVTAADESQLWATNYDRVLDDLLAIRTDVATRVAEALKGKLLGEERQQLTKRGTENAEAYRFYLQGRYLWNRRTPDDIKQAIEYFNQALGKDPSYALAYSGLADCYNVLPFYTGLSRLDAFPKSRAAALEALKLDSNLAEPHAALADMRAWLDWDWSGAEVEFRQAIALNPNYATTHLWFSSLLETLGRHDEALAEIRRAQELDFPASSMQLLEPNCS